MPKKNFHPSPKWSSLVDSFLNSIFTILEQKDSQGLEHLLE